MLVALIRAEQNGNTVVGAGDEQSVRAGLNAVQAVTAQSVTQNDQAGGLNPVNRLLYSQLEILRYDVQPIIKKGNLVSQVSGQKTLNQILKDLAGDNHNRQRGRLRHDELTFLLALAVGPNPVHPVIVPTHS